MSLLRNPFEQAKNDAVAAARSGNPNLASLASNFTGGDQSGASGDQLTRPADDGRTIGPYIVDQVPLDDPHFYLA